MLPVLNLIQKYLALLQRYKVVKISHPDLSWRPALSGASPYVAPGKGVGIKTDA